MNVHVLQHVAFEGPGSITDWCVANDHPLTITHLYQADAELPNVESIDLLVIMGGPMNVYEEDLFPFLPTEKDFILKYLATAKPTLGICLGAQLLALCCGVKVGRARHLEIGWFPVKPTPAARRHPWLYALLESEPVLFHWHGDRFEIPEDSDNLTVTDANDNQAFILDGGRIIGLQFHPEVTPTLLEQMVAEGRHELVPSGFVQSANAIVSRADYRDAGTVMRGVLHHLEALTKLVQ